MLLGLQTGSHMVHRWATWALQRSKRGLQEESILEGLLWTSLMYSYVAKVHFHHLWPDIWHKIEKPPTRFVPFWLAWWWPTTSMLRGGRWWSEVLASLPSLNSWYTAGIQLQQGLPGLSKLCLAYANSKHPQNITKPLCNVTWWKFKNFQNFDGSPKVNDFTLFVCVKRDHRLPRGVLFCRSAISPADNHYFFRMVFEIGRRHVQRDLCMSHVCGKCKCPWWVPAQHILYHPDSSCIFQECLVMSSHLFAQMYATLLHWTLHEKCCVAVRQRYKILNPDKLRGSYGKSASEFFWGSPQCHKLVSNSTISGETDAPWKTWYCDTESFMLNV